MNKIMIKATIVIITGLTLLGIAGIYFKIELNNKYKKDTTENTQPEIKKDALLSRIDQTYICDFDINTTFYNNAKQKFGFEELEIFGNYYFNFDDENKAYNGLIVIGYKSNNLENFNKMDLSYTNGEILEDEDNLKKYIISQELYGWEEAKSMTLEQYYQFLAEMKFKDCRLIE